MPDLNDNSKNVTTPKVHKIPFPPLTFDTNNTGFNGFPPAFDAKMAQERRSFHKPQSEKGYFYKEGKFLNNKGLNWFITGLFLVGDLAGGGLVALPKGLLLFGLFHGLLYTLFMAVTVCYTAYLLGQTWLILQRRWPAVYTTDHCRKPYPEIAYRALGFRAKSIVSVCITVTQFGVAVVYLLLSANNISGFAKFVMGVEVGSCLLSVLLAIALLPLTFLKSPQDFWGAVVIAMITTSMAVILIIWGAVVDYPYCSVEHRLPEFSFINYFLAIGTFIFAYGGHAVFPTIQHDMLKPHHFTRSSIMAFTIMTFMYAPVAVIGYLTYGDSLTDSIIGSLQTQWIQQSVNMLITVHCILTLTIVFNPLNQEAEEILGVPQQFCLKRVLVRSFMMFAVVFVAVTVPSFGPMVDLIGGSTLSLTSLVFPCVFYLYLVTGEKMEHERREQHPVKGSNIKTDGSERVTLLNIVEKVDKKTLIICVICIGFGILGGGAATFSALRQMSSTHIVPPCYVSYFLDMNEPIKNSTAHHYGHTNCCGYNQTLSIYSKTDYCAKPDLARYVQ